MCPDNQLISAYFDDELDSKWSEQVESHISSCRECSRKLEAYRQLSAVLESGVISEEQELKARVLGEIQRRHAVYSSDVFWRRHLNVSVPVLMAAAALIVIFFAGLLFGFIPTMGGGVQVVEEIKPDNPEINIQVINVEDAAAYILSDDSGFDLLITIPMGETLSVAGEPKLIREADYRRGQ